MIQNIKNDEDSMNERIAIPFFSVFFIIVMIESMIPATVRATVILSPTILPAFAILVGVIKTNRKHKMPMSKDI